MKLWNHYHTPKTVEDAAGLLRDYAGQARVIAGGTDLLIDARAALQTGKYEFHHALVDITQIPELAAITDEGDSAVIGAGVTHTTIVKSPLLASRATCLTESCGVVGGPQVRNVATLGGNVAHALPAGDGTTSLVALDAEAEIWQDGQKSWHPIQALFRGPGVSLLDSTRDILLRFRVPLSNSGQGSAFNRIMRPQGVALPVLGCAVWVQLDTARTTITAARICLAPISPTPSRATAVEEALIGTNGDTAALESAIQVALETLRPRTSKYRATAEYRSEMIAVLLRRTLPKAIERASKEQ